MGRAMARAMGCGTGREWGLPEEDFSNYVTVVMRIGAGFIGGLPRLTPRAK
jgi:hypothetical protein